MHVYSSQLFVLSVSNQCTSPYMRDLVMNAEISKRHISHNRVICSAQAATLTDLTHTGYSESHCGHVRKSYSNASQICQKYSCSSRTQLAAPTDRHFFQTNKVCFFSMGVTSQSDSNLYNLSCLAHIIVLTSNIIKSFKSI